MRRTKIALLFLCTALCFLLSITSLENTAIAADNAIALNIEDIKKRAKEHYIDVKLAKLNKISTAAQLKYTEAQLDGVYFNDKHLSPTVLPTTLEELRATIEGYDELTQEQQLEIDYMLSIQLMINQSLNPILHSSYVSQQYQNDSSLQSLKDNLYSLEGQIKVHELEIARAESLVQYQAAYMYYELIKLENEIKIQEIISKQATQRASDMKKLHQFGYVHESELEQADRDEQQQQNLLSALKKQYAHQLAIMSGELGYSDKQQIELLNPLIPLKATLFTFDDKKVLEQNIDYQIEQQKLDTELERYKEATWYDQDLSELHSQSITVQEMKFELTRDQIKSKMNSLKFEASNQYDKLLQQELKLKDQEQHKAGYEQKYNAGIISISELEKVQLQYQIEQLQLVNMKLSYEQFHEKWKLAILGVLL